MNETTDLFARQSDASYCVFFFARCCALFARARSHTFKRSQFSHMSTYHHSLTYSHAHIFKRNHGLAKHNSLYMIFCVVFSFSVVCLQTVKVRTLMAVEAFVDELGMHVSHTTPAKHTSMSESIRVLLLSRGLLLL